MGLDTRKNSEVGCSCELDCVLVEETMHTHTYRESNPMVKTLRPTVDFVFIFLDEKQEKIIRTGKLAAVPHLFQLYFYQEASFYLKKPK